MDIRYGTNWGHPHETHVPERWILETNYDGSSTLQVVVDRSWNGTSWNSYRSFVISDIGEVRELVTEREYLEQYSAFLEYEGDCPPDSWTDRWVCDYTGIEQRNDVIRRWEAIVDQLKLLRPSITH